MFNYIFKVYLLLGARKNRAWTSRPVTSKISQQLDL